MTRLLYSLAWIVATPFVLVRLAWRARRQPGYLHRLGERFGRYRPRLPGPYIWVHAVSVGETRAASPLVDALQARYPGHRILVTHMTPTGRATSREISGDRVERAWLPYDMGFAVRRFLEHYRPAFGLDANSARERIAARFYDVKVRVPRDLHAVERNRLLVGEVFGYVPSGTARYGLLRPDAPPSWAPSTRYVVMLHGASRAAKRWPDERWVELGRMLGAQGYAAVFPGGSDRERADARRLAAQVPDALAAPVMTLIDAAALLGHAEGVVGVDTGLTHLAVALGVPTVGIYCATRPELTGLHGGENATNVGAPGAPPSVAAVAAAIGMGSADE